MAGYGALAGVVAGQGQAHVAPELPQQPAQVGHAATQVLFGIPGVLHAEAPRGRRDQLHQALRVLGRAGIGAKGRLGGHHLLDQRRIERVLRRQAIDELLDRLPAGADQGRPTGHGRNDQRRCHVLARTAPGGMIGRRIAGRGQHPVTEHRVPARRAIHEQLGARHLARAQPEHEHPQAPHKTCRRLPLDETATTRDAVKDNRAAPIMRQTYYRPALPYS